MADVEVRSIVDDEIAAYVRCIGTAFFMGAPVEDDVVAFWRERLGDLSRRHAGFVGDALAGTAGAFDTQLTVPGGATVPIGAITGVTVLPTHRRRGLLRRMMDVQLNDCIDRGEVAAMLIAAEWPIYGRFGYGIAIEAATTLLDSTTARFTGWASDDGAVELVTLDELRSLAPAVFDRHRVSIAGAIERGSMTWDLRLGQRVPPHDEPRKGVTAIVHRAVDGTADGYAVYRAANEWVDNRPRVSLEVDELIALDDAAYRALWSFLANVDWVAQVRAGVRPVDEPLRVLLEDGRAAVQRDRSDHMWLRLLDIRRALAERTYETPVDIVIDVVDDTLGRGGRWRLEGGPDGASAAASTLTPDVSLSVDALGGSYLGGTPLWWFAQAGKVDENRPGAVAELGAALRTARAPWCTTGF